MLGNIEVQRLGNDTTQPQYAQQTVLVPTGPYVLGGTSNGPGFPTLSYLTNPPTLVTALPREIPQGDLNYNTNEVFTALLLFFAIGLSVAAAYDRARNVRANPLLLTLFSSMAMLGYFIYAARRIGLGESQQSIHPAFGSQVLIVVGLGITLCCEILRFIALIWLYKRTVVPSTVEKIIARKFYYWLYIIFDILMLITLLAYLIVLLGIQSEEGLFNRTNDTFLPAPQFYGTIATGQYLQGVQAQLAAGQITAAQAAAASSAAGIAAAQAPGGAIATGATTIAQAFNAQGVYVGQSQIQVLNNPRWTYLNGQNNAEDALVWIYQVFVISLLIGGWCIGINLYARVRNDRVGNLVAFSTFVVHCAGYWLMCWPVAYAAAFEEGYLYRTFCRHDASGGYVFTENLCDEVAAGGRLIVILSENTCTREVHCNARCWCCGL